MALLSLAGQAESLVEANRARTEWVERREERLGRSSRNSSLAPSSDPLGVLKQPPRKGSGRRPGGQPGHPGTTRLLAARERLDELVEHWPERRVACGDPFADAEGTFGEPLCHEVSEPL